MSDASSSARFDSDNRVALVTGAAGDIGGSVALDLAARFATVILADHPHAADSLAAAEQRCREHSAGPTVQAVTFDVTDPAQVASTLDDVVSDFGPPTAVFNSAGIQGEFCNVTDASPSVLRSVLAVNVEGVFNVVQATARAMIEAGAAGAIVNAASMAGVSGAPNMAAYSASKAAVIGLTKSCAKDLAPHGIRVCAVSPGFIGPGAMWDRQVEAQAATPSPYYLDRPEEVAQQMIGQIPLGRYGSLAEVAAAACFLLSDEASYLTGVNLEISGGAA